MPRKKDYGLYTKLPIPDDYGNYWFKKSKDVSVTECVVVLTREANHKSEKKLAFMLSLGPKGVVWDGTVIREFVSAVQALEYLHELIDKGEFVP